MSFYFSGNVVDQNLIPVVGADIYVYAGGDLATGLQDAAGASLANPLKSGANGFYEAYSTQGGSHVLRFFWGGRLRYIESIGEAVIAGPVKVTTITGTAHTVTRDNAYCVLRFTSNSAVTLTLPSDTAANIPIGAAIEINQNGTGQITLAAGSGATLEIPSGVVRTRGQHSVAGARKVAANTWLATGDLTA